ncbi:MAG: hypothetical protein FJ147_27640 [Deltaproteobacteria bacterium]|nr:hypothetical protein [Deltaproteobacteria bacterium]
MWKDIVTTAIIGTERQALTIPQLNNATGALFAQLDPNDRERTLLCTAAVVMLYERAGRVAAAAVQPTMTPCEEETLAPCSLLSAQHLSMMLNGQYKDVLPEWLTAISTIQRRAPEEYLPALLEAGRTHSALRSAILPVLGQRGIWLAQQNPAWNYVASTTNASAWETGNLAARLEFLQKLRSTDPQQARELLAANWQQETPEDRATFLEALRTNLGLADESFLESALDDRRKEVRRVAVDLLASLPDSALCRRMIDRIRPLVTISRKWIVKDTLTVTLPERCDDTMIRDGIESKAPGGKGQKAWWLQQMIGIVPPSFWCQESGQTPGVLIQLSQRSEWQEPFLQGWVQAALRSRDIEWIEALLSEPLPRQGVSDKGLLFRALPPNRQEHFARQVLQAEFLSGTNRDTTSWILSNYHHQWSEQLSQSVWDQISRYLPGETKDYFWWNAFLTTIAPYINPIVSTKISTNLSGIASSNAAIEKFLNTLQFRHDMLKEINR